MRIAIEEFLHFYTAQLQTNAESVTSWAWNEFYHVDVEHVVLVIFQGYDQNSVYFLIYERRRVIAVNFD